MPSLSAHQIETVQRLFSADDRSYRELADAIEAVPSVERMLFGVAERLRPGSIHDETTAEELIRSRGTRWVMRYLSAYAKWRKIRGAGRRASQAVLESAAVARAAA